MDKDAVKDIYLIFEVERAIKLLRLGLAEIQKISGANDFYDPIFMYLSGGVERLFKVMITLSHIELYGTRPSPNELWEFRKGHDLIYLKSLVDPICKDLQTPWLSKDYNTITQNEEVDAILKILGEFGKFGRYFDLDIAVGRTPNFEPKRAWERFETIIGKRILGNEGFYEKLRSGTLEDLYEQTNKAIIVLLEEYFRGLTRQFIHGAFSSKGRLFYYQLSDFSDLEDEQIGKIDYRLTPIHQKLRR